MYGQAKLRGASGNSFIPVVCRRALETCAALHPERIPSTGMCGRIVQRCTSIKRRLHYTDASVIH